MTELRDSSLPWLLARWREVHAEHERLDEMTACVEPASAADALRRGIQHDYDTIKAELAERRQLAQWMAADAYEDGVRLLLIPPPD